MASVSDELATVGRGPTDRVVPLLHRGKRTSPTSTASTATHRALRHSAARVAGRSSQAIARAEAVRGKRGTAGQRADALPMQEPGQERLGRADVRRPASVDGASPAMPAFTFGTLEEVRRDFVGEWRHRRCLRRRPASRSWSAPPMPTRDDPCASERVLALNVAEVVVW
jgi:hypothetical protein